MPVETSPLFICAACLVWLAKSALDFKLVLSIITSIKGIIYRNSPIYLFIMFYFIFKKNENVHHYCYPHLSTKVNIKV